MSDEKSRRHQHTYADHQREAFYKAGHQNFVSYASNRSAPRRYASTRYQSPRSDGRGLLVSRPAYRSFASQEVGSFGTTSRYEASNNYAVGSRRYEPSRGYTASSSYGPGGRPSAWCGWEMRQLVGGDPGPEYNLASNWAHWGHAAGGPAPGVVGVMAHHVIKVISVVGRGEVMAISGNDGQVVRTRLWSTSGVFAWRRA